MSAPFVHLHAHSHFSLLNALPKIDELVAAAKADGMDALALTDNGNLYGAIEFYKACTKNDIKPIIGIDAYLAPRGRFEKEAGVDNRYGRLVLLARDITGYKNLLKLATKGFLEGFYYKPRIDRELLERHGEGLTAIIPSYSGEVAAALRMDDAEKAREALAWYQHTFGADHCYLEVTHHPEIENHAELQERIKAFAKEQGAPLVAAQDIFYIKPEDRIARETLVKIQTGGALSEHELASDDAADFSFLSSAHIREYFANMPDAVANTKKIADACNLELELGSWVFPDLHVESGRGYDEALRERTYAGIEKRGMRKTDEVEKRIEYELEIIQDKGFSPYFLVVADLLDFAREHEILSTTRGSAAGSLVSYLNGITNIDPLAYELPFERFLNPERPKAPDIDMDFADDRRDEVIQYAREKYGADKVAQIGTFGTMLARGVVRDVARALGYPYATGDRIARLIPFGSQGFPMTIKRARDMVPEFDELCKSEKEVEEIIKLSEKIEGCARHISVHAAGVVIAPTELTDWVPLQFDPKGERESGKLITQYNMHAVEDAGLLKFDFLGIRNLSILADSVKRVKENHRVDIDIENVPLDDAKTFEMLARGETMGLFQLNGQGMTRYLKDLKPASIHDINAMIALYRPGPMDVLPQYIERKNNPSLVTYPDPRMEKYLEKSYGLIVYQDDLLFSAIELAGYSWLEVDQFRKAVGKKIPAEMAAQKEKFIKGVIENGQTKEFADYIWRLFEPFQAYGFNKAHAASYGKVAYQTAYMKANYPVEYMAALLTADSGNVEKVAEAVTECARLGIPVLPPDVNESFSDFTIVPKPETVAGEHDRAIRFGLRTIKNFGEGISNSIMEERASGGRFTSLGSFLSRIHDRNLNRKSLEALIQAGALDALGERAVMYTNIESLLAYTKERHEQPSGQDSLFGALGETDDAQPRMDLEPRVSADEILAWEKELLGLYVSGHPLDKYKETLARQKKNIAQTKEDTPEGITTIIVGIIENPKPILTKSSEQMLFLTLRDYTDAIEAVIFPRVFADYRETLAADCCVALKGRLSARNGETSFIVEAAKKL